MVQCKQIRLGTMRLWVRSLASLSGLRIRCCRELWCRLKMLLGSRVAVAVAVAGSNSSDLTPSLGTCICRGCGPKKPKNIKVVRVLNQITAVMPLCCSVGNKHTLYIFTLMLMLSLKISKSGGMDNEEWFPNFWKLPKVLLWSLGALQKWCKKFPGYSRKKPQLQPNLWVCPGLQAQGFRQVYVSKLIHSNCSHTGSRAQMQPQSNVEASSGPQKILLQGNDHLLCPKFTCHTPYVAWPRARVPSLDWVLAPPSLPMGWPWAVNKLHSHVRHPCREYPSHGELWSQNAGVWLVSASLTVGSWEGCWPLSRP